MKYSISISTSLIFLINLFIFFNARSQTGKIDKQTIVYSVKDTQTLKMDLYNANDKTVKKPCVLFVFGGGFIQGQKDDQLYIPYFNRLAENNFKVISIDYRLGLKGEKWPTVFNTSVLRNAIDMAVTDLYDATSYILEHAESLGIDTSMIILSGSSAGAVTTLQADWEKRNSTLLSQKLPQNFQYKGVIAFAGAILSYIGKPAYKIPPAPTMMFHGTNDKIVVYNKVKLFNRGMFGSRYLASLFRKQKYPYYFQYVNNAGHEIAGIPMSKNLDEIMWFINNYVISNKRYMMEVDFSTL